MRWDMREMHNDYQYQYHGHSMNDMNWLQNRFNCCGVDTITDWKNYENIKGCIQFDNISYNYVKMKITRTALYLMCVPNYNTTRIASQNVIDAKQARSVPVSKKQHIPFGKATLQGNFNVAFVQFSFSSFEKALPGHRVLSSGGILTLYHDIPRQPPKFTC